MAFGYVDTRTIECFKMSIPLVFKFGGASVKDADSVRNVARIIGLFAQRPMVVVVSAMGKTTNAFEEVFSSVPTLEPKTAWRFLARSSLSVKKAPWSIS